MKQGTKKVLAVASLLLAAALRADGAVREDDELEDPPDAIGEVDHTVALRFTSDREAEYQVTRTLHNRGRVPEEATRVFALPERGAVTGFRVIVEGRTYQGRILPGDAAEARYTELTSPGPGLPRTVALLQLESLGAASVNVFPVLPGESVVVQYEVVAATDYEGGRLHASYPGYDPEAGEPRPRLSATAAWKGAAIESSSAVLPPDDDGDPIEVSVTPPPTRGVAARFAELGLARDRRLVRLELEAAPQLSELPRAARVVFVVDGSWSENDAGVAAQLELVRGYLRHVPDASFEIVVFARRAHRVLGRFEAATRVDAALAEARRAGAFAPANGSDPVAGLALAAGLRPTRLVLLTDRAFARAYSPATALRALASLPRETVVHVVERSAGGGSLEEERVDGADFETVVAAHGGQILSIWGQSNDLDELAAITLGLVRPIRIDDFEVVAAGAFAEAPAPLAEGEGFRAFELVEAPLASVTLRGRIWGKPFERRLAPDSGLAARLPVLIFGDPLSEELFAGEAGQLGLHAGVLTTETSFLAEAPDAEPSTLGFDELEGGSGGSGSMCGRSASGCHLGVLPPVVSHVDWSAVLRILVTPGVEVCAGAHAESTLRARIDVEATDDEIVAVGVQGVSDPALRACVEDAVWDVRLDASFRGHRDYATEVAITPPAR